MNRQQRRAAERARTKASMRPPGAGDTSGPAAAAQRLLGEHRWDEAERTAREALDKDPADTTARAVLRTSLWRQGRLDEAMLEGRRVLRERPDDPAAHEALGFLLFSQDRVPESLAAFEKALSLSPDRWTAHVGLGNSMGALGDLGQALTHHQRAVELAPSMSATHNDLARTLFRMGDYDAAATEYERAAQHAGSRPALIEWNLSLSLLGTGDLTRGWAAYEAGLDSGARAPNRSPDVPRWAGEDLSDATLLVWGEQGLGDEVRFASCFPDVIEAADHVIIEANPRLVPLLARSFPDATVRGETFDRQAGHETIAFEGVGFHSPSGSLPRFVRPTIDSFPRRRGYLEADPQQRERWRKRLAALPAGLRVGICWRSMNLATDRLSHYTTLDEWGPILGLAGLTFVNLQYGSHDLRERELSAAEEHFGITVHRWDDIDYTHDLEAVAGLTAEVDAVVGPNTFASILAGALGVPTLTIGLPPHWLHGMASDPWAPTTTHYVRRWDEPWEPAMERAADDLRARAAAITP